MEKKAKRKRWDVKKYREGYFQGRGDLEREECKDERVM
jgi:hypothetical protein